VAHGSYSFFSIFTSNSIDNHHNARSRANDQANIILFLGYALDSTLPNRCVAAFREDSPPAPLEKEESRRSLHGENLILPGLFLPPEKTLHEFLIGQGLPNPDRRNQDEEF
jgi:hypothetical protein